MYPRTRFGAITCKAPPVNGAQPGPDFPPARRPRPAALDGGDLDRALLMARLTIGTASPIASPAAPGQP